MSIDRDLEKWGPDLAAEERRFEQHLNNPADPLLQFGISAERLGAAYETLDILDDGSAPATRFGRVAGSARWPPGRILFAGLPSSSAKELLSAK